jgi:hypothetical protein
LYTAPAAVPSDPVITITATSVEDTARSGSMSVTIHSPFTSVEWAWMSGSDTPRQEGGYGVKGLPDPSNTPGGRYEAASGVDAAGRLWRFGGPVTYSPNPNSNLLNDLWRCNR